MVLMFQDYSYHDIFLLTQKKKTHLLEPPVELRSWKKLIASGLSKDPLFEDFPRHDPHFLLQKIRKYLRRAATKKFRSKKTKKISEKWFLNRDSYYRAHIWRPAGRRWRWLNRVRVKGGVSLQPTHRTNSPSRARMSCRSELVFESRMKEIKKKGDNNVGRTTNACETAWARDHSRNRIAARVSRVLL